MRYIMVIIWGVLISAVLSYVLTSMAGQPFNLNQSLTLAVIFSIIVYILGDGVLAEKNES
ncbi:MAG TPA: YjzD family protein [Bacillota bacterium]|nr:YjzD family protein [Bacillota bacterium]